MRVLSSLLVLITAFAGSALRAEAPKGGAARGGFDYYVLALSWTPNWCGLEGDARRDARCAEGAGLGWGLHGLWPQHERGYPSWCRTTQRDPSRAETAAMGRLMGSDGLAWHQWKKHGRCAGLSAADYFATSARAFESIRLPEVFERLETRVSLPARVVEDAFLEANPGLQRDMLTVTCRDRGIQEVRVCLTKDLEPRRCGADTLRDCTLRDAELAPPR